MTFLAINFAFLYKLWFFIYEGLTQVLQSFLQNFGTLAGWVSLGGNATLIRIVILRNVILSWKVPIYYIKESLMILNRPPLHTAPRGGQNYFFKIGFFFKLGFFGPNAKFKTLKVVCYSKMLNSRHLRALNLPLHTPHFQFCCGDTANLLCKTPFFHKLFHH